MLKKFHLSFAFLGVLMTAFLMLPQLTMAAAPQKSAFTPNAINFAFVARATSNTVARGNIYGGLALLINPRAGLVGGQFNGTDGYTSRVYGTVNPFTFSFQISKGLTVRAIGSSLSFNGAMSGTFIAFHGFNQVATGTWSAVVVAPYQTAYAVRTAITTTTSTNDGGILVLNSFVNSGTVILPNGTTVALTDTRIRNQITITYPVNGTTITALGLLNRYGIYGTFSGPSVSGTWQAKALSFDLKLVANPHKEVTPAKKDTLKVATIHH